MGKMPKFMMKTDCKNCKHSILDSDENIIGCRLGWNCDFEYAIK